MYTEEMLEKYADVLVKKGVNIQKGQYLLLQCCPDTLPLARNVAEKALKLGAKDVHVSISDPYIKQIRGKYLSEKQCREVPEWKKEEEDFYLRNDGVQLGIMGTYPDLMEDVSDENAMALAGADNEVRNVVRKYIHEGTLQWTGTAYPTKEWAIRVYPEMKEEDALAQLEKDIAMMMRLDQDDSVKAWDEHCAKLKSVGDKLKCISVCISASDK